MDINTAQEQPQRTATTLLLISTATHGAEVKLRRRVHVVMNVTMYTMKFTMTETTLCLYLPCVPRLHHQVRNAIDMNTAHDQCNHRATRLPRMGNIIRTQHEAWQERRSPRAVLSKVSYGTEVYLRRHVLLVLNETRYTMTVTMTPRRSCLSLPRVPRRHSHMREQLNLKLHGQRTPLPSIRPPYQSLRSLY